MLYSRIEICDTPHAVNLAWRRLPLSVTVHNFKNTSKKFTRHFISSGHLHMRSIAKSIYYMLHYENFLNARRYSVSLIYKFNKGRVSERNILTRVSENCPSKLLKFNFWKFLLRFQTYFGTWCRFREVPYLVCSSKSPRNVLVVMYVDLLILVYCIDYPSMVHSEKLDLYVSFFCLFR